MKRFSRSRPMVALLAAALLSGATAACSAAATAPPPPPKPTGASASAIMVCSDEAQADIQEALGIGVNQAQSNFSDGLYTCDYKYPTGTMVLTVKDLPDAATTDAYVAQQRQSLTKVHDLPGLGDAAFSDDTSTVVVRKDFKVLRVDTSALPATFGQPPHARYTVAVAVAAVIMLCWTGA